MTGFFAGVGGWPGVFRPFLGRSGRLPRLGVALGLLTAAADLAAGGWGTALAAEPYPELVVAGGVLHVNDGDTFEADLNGDGRLNLPAERVRLLYVDTPELGESHKGLDLKHGLPARAFLRKALAAGPLRLVFPGPRRHDRFGRALAVVFTAKKEVNLALIRQGHGYFDTRFGFSAAYEPYAEAEGEAFSARRGIWREAASRQAYLGRLQREGKTPRSLANPLFHPTLLEAGSLDADGLTGKFVRLRGRLERRKVFRKGARLLVLARGSQGFPVYVAGQVERKAASDRWALGATLLLDGFLTRYRGRAQLALHHGVRVAPRSPTPGSD